MRTSDIIVASLLSEKVLASNFSFSRSGKYRSIDADPNARLKSYLDYVEQLPLNAQPEVFGMHENAAITCAINEVVDTFAVVVSLQPRSATGGGISREDQIGNIAAELESQMIVPWDEEKVKLSYPIDYNESMNTILGQEIAKYNRLVKCLRETLSSLQLALKGLVVLSADLEAMGNALFDQQVPDLWTKVAYPSLKPLNAWFADFLSRTVGFMQRWIDNGIPASFWISGFFFPQGFLTAILQNYARKNQMPIDTVSFSVAYLDDEVESLTEKPSLGAYTYGLFFEGARWDKDTHVMQDPRPKELFSPMPVIHKIPEQFRETPQSGIYRCPVYKILSRRGVLSTTGHSTNFVLWLEVPSDKPTCFRSSLVSETNMQVQFCDNEYWVKGGVAAFCALRY
jgi:dynein heavy chain